VSGKIKEKPKETGNIRGGSIPSLERLKSRYDSGMNTKPTSSEYKAFENMLGQVLTVSKAELNRRIEQEKREKRSLKSASRASGVPSKPS
jgi:hypothetical protein